MSWQGITVAEHHGTGLSPVTCHLSPVTCQFGCELGRLQVLLAASADAKSKDKEGKTPCDLAQKNEDLKGTKAHWPLNDAQYN